jgi:hypothetical protein
MRTTLETASEYLTQPVDQAAAVEAALHAINNAYEDSNWMDFAQAIREHPEARRELEDLLWLGSEEEDARCAFGIGMVAGMLYASRLAAVKPGASQDAPQAA